METSINVEKTSIGNFVDKLNITIPPFQRSYVWKKDKQESLIDSIQERFPIGAFILYEEAMGEYLIVDGLQRYQTIKRFLNKPSDVYKFNDYYGTIRDELETFATNHNQNIEDLKTIARNWYINLESNGKSYAFDLIQPLNDLLKKKFKKEFGIDYVYSFRKLLVKTIDIRDREIAIIHYRGEKDRLAAVFENVNKENVSLNAYEILHSQWFKLIFNKSNRVDYYKEEFIKIVQSKNAYISTTDSSFDTNLYMIISAYGDDIYHETEMKKYSNEKRYLKPVLFFDAFSLISTGRSNALYSSKSLFFNDDNKLKCDEKYVFDVLDAIKDSISRTMDYLKREEFKNSFYSRYYFLYIFYCIFNTKYRIDNLIVNISNVNKEIPESFFNKLNNNSWFKDENRQVSFFDGKIKELIEEIKNGSLEQFLEA